MSTICSPDLSEKEKLPFFFLKWLYFDEASDIFKMASANLCVLCGHKSTLMALQYISWIDK